MKTLSKIALVVLLMLTTNLALNAGQTECSKQKLDISKIEANLLVGLASENLGLKTSSAYLLGELKAEGAVNALENVLLNDEDQRVRLMAALSLVKIGTERSLYIVKRHGKFGEFERVNRMCERLYNAHLDMLYQKEFSDFSKSVASIN